MAINSIGFNNVNFKSNENKPEVVAKYIGGNDEEGYRVNVKTAHPKGMIGDAGVIRFFDTKEEAKEYTAEVNRTKSDVLYQLPEKYASVPTDLVVNTYKQ